MTPIVEAAGLVKRFGDMTALAGSPRSRRPAVERPPRGARYDGDAGPAGIIAVPATVAVTRFRRT